MKKIIPKHPLAIRWMHWINFPVLFVMIWSGMLIYWANDIFKIRWGSKVIYSFFPESFYRALNIAHRLAEGMAFHFVFMWIFFINGLVYVLYTFFSGEWRLLVPDRHSFKEALLVTLHDLHLRKTAPPQLKYNGAQKIAYTAIIIMGFGSIITGLAIYKPIQFRWINWLCGGYGTARILHFILTIGYCLFFVIHVIQVILAGWNNFRAMVAGFDIVTEQSLTVVTGQPLAVTGQPLALATAPDPAAPSPDQDPQSPVPPTESAPLQHSNKPALPTGDNPTPPTHD